MKATLPKTSYLLLIQSLLQITLLACLLNCGLSVGTAKSAGMDPAGKCTQTLLTAEKRTWMAKLGLAGNWVFQKSKHGYAYLFAGRHYFVFKNISDKEQKKLSEQKALGWIQKTTPHFFKANKKSKYYTEYTLKPEVFQLKNALTTLVMSLQSPLDAVWEIALVPFGSKFEDKTLAPIRGTIGTLDFLSRKSLSGATHILGKLRKKNVSPKRLTRALTYPVGFVIGSVILFAPVAVPYGQYTAIQEAKADQQKITQQADRFLNDWQMTKALGDALSEQSGGTLSKELKTSLALSALADHGDLLGLFLQADPSFSDPNLRQKIIENNSPANVVKVFINDGILLKGIDADGNAIDLGVEASKGYQEKISEQQVNQMLQITEERVFGDLIVGFIADGWVQMTSGGSLQPTSKVPSNQRQELELTLKHTNPLITKMLGATFVKEVIGLHSQGRIDASTLMQTLQKDWALRMQMSMYQILNIKPSEEDVGSPPGLSRLLQHRVDSAQEIQNSFSSQGQ